MQSGRSKKLINLALNSNIDAPIPNKIHIIEERIRILDEKEGIFIFSQSTLQEEQDPNNNFILDEQSGRFFLTGDDNGGDDFNYSGSESEYELLDEEFDSDSSSVAGSSSRLLDDSTGAIKVKRARKGQGNKQSWTKNTLKRKRMRGQEYASIKRTKNDDKVMEKRQPRTLKRRCNSTRCTIRAGGKQCNDILEADRQKIFDSFWKLSWDEKKMFVITMVTLKSASVRNEASSRRTNTLQYTLRVNSESKVVCKIMFCNTLDLGEWSVLNWVKATPSSGEIAIPKKCKPPKRVIPTNAKKAAHIIDFLTALPKMPSHYCRESTSFEYLDVNYTTWAEVYLDFEQYIISLLVDKKEKSTYKSFLDTVHKTNMRLYRPKKDQCDLCFAYKNKNIGEEEYSKHIEAKDRARKEKAEDKARCLNGELQMVTVDLQAVQNVPKIAAGAVYFKLKLSVHQFTIYNEKDKSVVCYVWHEGEGGMDANIFASCLIDYLEKLEDKTKPIIIYSDGCSAQNRNCTLANALLNFASMYNIDIFQKYLIVGHTQMECDSVHATIEHKKKQKELYVPADFNRIIVEARRAQPYVVRYLDHTFFNDFSSIGYLKSIRPGTKKGDPCVVNLRALRYNNEGAWYKLNFDDPWSNMPHRVTRRPQGTSVAKLYKERLPITKRKYEDLQDLKRLLPVDYHSFYDNLLCE